MPPGGNWYHRGMKRYLSVVLLGVAALGGVASADEKLDVGPGEKYARIEEALEAAHAGDTIVVHPLADGKAYERVALMVRTPRLHIMMAPGRPRQGIRAGGAITTHPARIVLRGEGFDYSGVGKVPRAIVQFDPGADGCVLEGFELSGARNGSHNGAGVRINQANHVTVKLCTITGNDMGIMSNGDGTVKTGIDQRIERCLIYGNGSKVEPGMSHNLYLGATSVVVSGCEVHSSVTGHNVKSRAHYTRVEYCWVHDSANRELDLVDAKGDTDVAGSDAVVFGTVLSKAVDMKGNREVIHFGQDGGNEHKGTLHVVNSTIVTGYVSPVVTLSAPGAKVQFVNSLFSDAETGQKNQVLVGVSGKAPEEALAARVKASHNVFRGDFKDVAEGAGVRLSTAVGFANAAAGDYRVVTAVEALRGKGVVIGSLGLPGATGRDGDQVGMPWQRYLHPQSKAPRRDDWRSDVGAFECERPAGVKDDER